MYIILAYRTLYTFMEFGSVPELQTDTPDVSHLFFLFKTYDIFDLTALRRVYPFPLMGGPVHNHQKLPSFPHEVDRRFPQ